MFKIYSMILQQDWVARVLKLNVFVVCMCLIAAPAWGTTVLSMPLADITRNSDLVAVASVLSKQILWRNGRIYTRATLKIEERWVNQISAQSPQITLELLGGVIGEIGQKVMGEPVVEVGQRVVLFAHHRESDDWVPVAMGQGMFLVTDNSVQRNLTEVQKIGPRSNEPQSLADLKAQVLDVMGAR